MEGQVQVHVQPEVLVHVTDFRFHVQFSGTRFQLQVQVEVQV